MSSSSLFDKWSNEQRIIHNKQISKDRMDISEKYQSARLYFAAYIIMNHIHYHFYACSNSFLLNSCFRNSANLLNFPY
ncbi:hypothetical protein Leryth_011600 [Lithospermum erythrorhizon]|nr:hypothetical protein Leryth_011600 [Lithospermum erythrorhizon]